MDSLNGLNNLQVGGQAGGVGGLGNKAAGTTGVDGAGSFKDVLMKNLNEVNQLQQDADKSLENFVTGKTNNMGEVISASQKASMAFSMLTQMEILTSIA